MTLWSHASQAGLVMGPLVVPDETASRVCASVDALNPGLAGAGEASAVAMELLGHLTAMEALKVLTGYTSSTLGGRVVLLDAVTLESTYHTLVRLPWCRVCGA
jgi:hypothetical protein